MKHATQTLLARPSSEASAAALASRWQPFAARTAEWTGTPRELRANDGDEPNLAVLKNPKLAWDLMVERKIVVPASSGGGWQLAIDDPAQLSIALFSVGRDLRVPAGFLVDTMDAMLSLSEGPADGGVPAATLDAQGVARTSDDSSGETGKSQTEVGMTVSPSIYGLTPYDYSVLDLGTSNTAAATVSHGWDWSLLTRQHAELTGEVGTGATLDPSGLTPYVSAGLNLATHTNRLSTNLRIEQQEDSGGSSSTVSGNVRYTPMKGVDFNLRALLEKSWSDDRWPFAVHAGATISIDALAKGTSSVVKSLRRRFGR